MTGKRINADKPDCRDGVHRNGYPHAVRVGELDGDVEIFDPERRGFERDPNDLPDAVCLSIHPNVAKEQTLFRALGNDVQHVLRNHAEVLLAQEDEIIVRSADVSSVTFFGRSYFLLQNGAYDLFASGVTLRIGDFESLDVGRSKADLAHYIRDGLRIVTLEYLIFPRHFVWLREGWVLLLDSLQRIENRVQIWRGFSCFLRA